MILENTLVNNSVAFINPKIIIFIKDFLMDSIKTIFLNHLILNINSL